MTGSKSFFWFFSNYSSGSNVPEITSTSPIVNYRLPAFRVLWSWHCYCVTLIVELCVGVPVQVYPGDAFKCVVQASVYLGIVVCWIRAAHRGWCQVWAASSNRRSCTLAGRRPRSALYSTEGTHAPRVHWVCRTYEGKQTEWDSALTKLLFLHEVDEKSFAFCCPTSGGPRISLNPWTFSSLKYVPSWTCFCLKLDFSSWYYCSIFLGISLTSYLHLCYTHINFYYAQTYLHIMVNGYLSVFS